jgi:hypothetical protein
MRLRTIDAAGLPELRAAARELEAQMRDSAGTSWPILVYDRTAFALLVLPLAPEALPADPAEVWPLDAEMLALSFDPEFRAAIEHAREQARQGLGVPAEEVRRRLGITDEERDRYLRRRRRTKARP